ncbi:MAG TPA: sigma-70 family RNA polymerase sigma factor [Caulobacteraceae bacterium]|nr:sigma-70 family RNA polymerase sigma factor [Caulobacteraceae bacterium]
MKPSPEPPTHPAPSPLLGAYLQRREDLKRFFALRLRSTEAAEDLVQDMYLKISAVDPAVEIGNPAAFLYRLGGNLMLDRMKAQRRAVARDGGWRTATVVSIAGEDIADLPSAEDAAASRQRLERLVAALNDLAPAVRRAFRLHKLEGLSHAETATAMGVSRSSVEKYISAALKHLVRTVGA